MFTRRAFIGGAAGLLMAKAAAAQIAATPGQTSGPFYPRRFPSDSDADLTIMRGGGRAMGDVLEVTGRILSAQGQSLEGAVVEIWQADAFGRYDHPLDQGLPSRDRNFQGYGRVQVGADGAYRFRTIKPRHYDMGDGNFRTPHIHYKVRVKDGRELVTQLYFPGEALNETDFLYQGLPDDTARNALTARPVKGELPRFVFDMVLA